MRTAMHPTVALMLSALALVGCNIVRFSYGYADNYFVGMVQDYFDPTPEQLKAARANAQALLAWHRQHELPLYVAMFEQAAQKIGDGLNEDEVRWALAQVRERYDTLAARVIAANAPLLARLSAENFAALERKLGDDNAKLERTYAAANPSQRDERRAQRVETQLERWIGALSAEQRAIVAAWVAAAPNASVAWQQARAARQQQLLALLHSEREAQSLAAQLSELWLGRSAASPERARNEARLSALILSIDASLSPTQRSRAAARMQQYAEDFASLRH